MQRLSVSLRSEQYEWVIAEAQRGETSVSGVLRRLIRHAIEDENEPDRYLADTLHDAPLEALKKALAMRYLEQDGDPDRDLEAALEGEV